MSNLGQMLNFLNDLAVADLKGYISIQNSPVFRIQYEQCDFSKCDFPNTFFFIETAVVSHFAIRKPS